jgi:hypothetical protein
VDTTATPKVCKACDAGKVLAAGEVIASSTKTCAAATTCKEDFYVDTTASPKVCKACAAGKHIAAGDAEGKVYLFEVADRLALAGVDEQQKFKNTIKDIELSSQEAIEPST